MRASLGKYAAGILRSAVLPEWPDDELRLLRIEAEPALAAALVPLRARLREAVNAPFELALEALAGVALPGLPELIGTPLALRLKLADGRHAPWHGHVAQARWLAPAAGRRRCRLVLRPWLSWLGLRQDSYLFQDQTALQIVQEVFADYPAARWRLACAPATLQALRVREHCMQYRESDFDFVTRLLAQEGLHWYFEQAEDEAGAAQHRLVIADALDPGRDLGSIPFAAQHPTAFRPGLEDPVTDFMTGRQAVSNAVALGSWDPAQLAGPGAARDSRQALGTLPRLERYASGGERCFADAAAAGRAAGRALSALELDARRFTGLSGVRRLGAGMRFTLVGHPVHGPDARCTVLAVEHRAANNLGAAARGLDLPEMDGGAYRNRFEAVPADAPLVPPAPGRPTALASLSAHVVGQRGAALGSDRDHRVKVQFHFQRGRAPNPGGLPHAGGADTEGHAPGDLGNGTWLRVASPAAGAGWGTVHTPRVGSEVCVQFLDGDIDRPVVAGGLYHGAEAPPFAAGHDSGVNHPGVLSGLQRRRIDGAGLNQWVLDDSSGQLRMRLHADYAHSEFALGHLIRQDLHGAWRGAWRGAGIEGCTQGWATLRAAQGLLLSTHARPGSDGSAQGPQLDATEALAQLRAARELGQSLGAAARAVQAPGPVSPQDGQALPSLIAALDPRQQGRHPERVNGQAARQPGADGRRPGPAPVPAFAEPVALLDAAAAALLASEASVHAWAGAVLGATAQGDVQFSAAGCWAQAVGGTAGLYAHQGGLQAKAANGALSLRAHTDALCVLADQALTVTSTGEEIRIAAQQRVRFVGGDSAVTLDGTDIKVATPGTFKVRGATHDFLGAASRSAEMPLLPQARAEGPPR
ncbi:type VI secretion system Vgr family protein [Azohydromonas caseinilytica]|uniref:Type VI secretion system tip protein VgrG n=1 Tax=Azohydromonas caseinilytica TaxID=2728836 RepID=A0A848FC89_9BURK|nr:type VI secretion system Vgr family protein [Azohydromonas caseinilytica]NML16375.1 type VI secretion system tip protein VgrG [Azohydromonas caseinilytica]